MGLRTPLLIDTSTSFEVYLRRLSVKNRYKYKKNREETKDYIFTPIDRDPLLMRRFIRLWEDQLVYGHPIRWNKTMEEMDAIDTMMMFKAEKNNEIVAMHFIERCNDLAYAHPPLYDKSTPELARFIWFNTIRWCCENSIRYLDLDGGAGCDWVYLLKNRHDYSKSEFLKKLTYKWFYIPKDVKDNPELEVPYMEFRCNCGWKQLVIKDIPYVCIGHNRESKKPS